jgi:valyl-tRNA synthetase
VEVSKNRIQDETQKNTCLAVQDICLRQFLLMLHPFIPFITEELWSTLCFSSGESIESEKPGDGKTILDALQSGGIALDQSALKEMNEVRELVTQLRALKAERNLSSNRNIAFSFVANDPKAEAVQRNLTSILSTAGASAVNRVTEAPQGIPALVTPMGSFFLDLTVGVDLSAEKARLAKEIGNLEKIIQSIEVKLSNQAFISQAPPQVVEGARNQLIENQSKLEENQEALKAISS